MYRPTAKTAMEQIEDVLGNEEDDPYVAVDLVDLVNRATKAREITMPSMSSSMPSDKDIRLSQISGMQTRIEELKVQYLV